MPGITRTLSGPATGPSAISRSASSRPASAARATPCSRYTFSAARPATEVTWSRRSAFGADVEVLQPGELRTALREAGAALVELYGTCGIL